MLATDLSLSAILFVFPLFLLPLNNYSFSAWSQVSLPRSLNNAGPPGGNNCEELLFSSCSHKPCEVTTKMLYEHEASADFSDTLSARIPCSSVAYTDWLNTIGAFTWDVIYEETTINKFWFPLPKHGDAEQLKTYAVCNFFLILECCIALLRPIFIINVVLM